MTDVLFVSQHVELSRVALGVVTARLHSGGDTLVLTDAALADLTAAFQAIAQDRGVRVLVLFGAGEGFVGSAPPDDTSPVTIAQRAESEIAFARALADLPMPVIAAVNGAVEAHAEVALFADLVLAADDARFGDDRWRSGRPPAGAALSAWQAAIGHARANLLLIGSVSLSADEGLALGFVHQIAPRDGLAVLAVEHATRLAAQPDLALRFTRQTMIRRLRQRFEDDAPLSLALSGVAALGADGWVPATPPIKETP